MRPAPEVAMRPAPNVVMRQAPEPLPLSVLALDAANNPTFAKVSKVMLEPFESLVLGGLGAMGPVGATAAGVYKVADVARALGAAATNNEDRTLGAELLAITSDAEFLKARLAQGYDQSSDARTQEVRARVKRRVETWKTVDQGAFSYLGSVILSNRHYAVGSVAIDKLIKHFVSRLFTIDLIKGYIGKPGDVVRYSFSKRGQLKPALSYVGWRKFEYRAYLAKGYVDKITSKLLAATIKTIIIGQIHKFGDGGLGKLQDKILRDHPPRPVLQQRARSEATRSAEYAALLAAPVPAPLLAAPQPPIILESARDPLARAIYTEDSYVRVARGSDAPTSVAEQRPPPPPPPQAPPAFIRNFHEAAMCVGVNKPGCNASWDGNRGRTLLGR